MLQNVHKPEVTTDAVATVSEVKQKPRRSYDKAARRTRSTAVLRTLLNLDAKEKGCEITISMLKTRLKMPFLGQVKKNQVNPDSITADLNVIVKEIGGLVEVRREKIAGTRGRPYVVYNIDLKKLTQKGQEILAAIEAEESRAAEASAKRAAAKQSKSKNK